MYGYSEGSIAEINIHENLVNLANMARDSLKVFNEIVDNLVSDIDVGRLYSRILELKSRIEDNKLLFMEYLVRLGEGLPYKQSYATIALGFERFTQLLDGASYRLTILKSRRLEISSEIYRYIAMFKDIVNEQFRNIFEGLRLLYSDPKKTLTRISEVSKLENRADEVYRNATFSLYTEYGTKVLTLMTLRDILDFIENAADLLRSLGEELRYLALHRIVVG
ncbi:MAG: DUF47 domain-containing protein [Thermoprotei archaeon]|nr:MAG: DUF47 domain-containing protein [Thermoprotei archaeon]